MIVTAASENDTAASFTIFYAAVKYFACALPDLNSA
jgi:hypothetical protein